MGEVLIMPLGKLWQWGYVRHYAEHFRWAAAQTSEKTDPFKNTPQSDKLCLPKLPTNVATHGCKC